MGILDRIFSAFDYGGDETTGDPPLNDYGDIRSWLDGYAYDIDATAQACITLITSQIAAMDLRALSRDTFEAVPEAERNSAGRFNKLMRDGVDGDTSFAFKARIVKDLLVYGNAWVYPEKGYDTQERMQVITDLKVVPNEAVSARRDEDGMLRYQVQGARRELTGADLIHIKMPTWHGQNRLLGVPPLAYASRTMQMARMASAQVYTNLERKLSPVVVVMDDGGGSAGKGTQSLESFYKAVKLMRGQEWRTFRTGANPTLLDLSPQPSDLKVLRDDMRDEVARAYHVPKPMLQIDSNQRVQGAEEPTRLLWQLALRPLIVNIEVALRPLVHQLYVINFDEEDALRGDLQSTAAMISAVYGPNHGALATDNEGRKRWLRMPPIEGGDVRQPAPGINLTMGAPNEQAADTGEQA